MNELVRDLAPRCVPTKSGRDRRRIAPGRALTGTVGYRRTDGQTDNLIPVYPPFNFVERGKSCREISLVSLCFHSRYLPLIDELCMCVGGCIVTFFRENLPYHNMTRLYCIVYIGGLVQNFSISIANALEILQSCTNHKHNMQATWSWL